MRKVMKIAGKPKLGREQIVKIGSALYNCEEVKAVSIEVEFEDNTKLTYESEGAFDFEDLLDEDD